MSENDGGADGISIRDYFAGLAMQAMISCYRTNMRGCDNAESDADSDLITFDRNMAIDTNGKTGEHDGCKELAFDAYLFADAMIEARKQETPDE